MRPAIVSVSFDHPATARGARPVPIRRDAATPVTPPEWRAGVSLSPADAPTAFALEGLAEAELTVQVVLRADEGELDVRARPLVGWGAPPPVLGDVAVRRVRVGPGGVSDPVTFAVGGVRLRDRGVGVNDVAWAWQARPGPGWEWSRIATTQHRLYSLLRAPVEPWSTAPKRAANSALAWTTLLEFACRWAAEARTRDAVAERITAAVNGLGAGILDYDCPGFGGSHYTYPFPTFHVFDCSQYVRLLRGLPYASVYVNCMDCAAMVSTTANLLGCDLWQSGMGNAAKLAFECNPVLAIGSGIWQTPCGWGGFAYHEVAWTGAGTAADDVYDACLRVDGNGPPGQPPFFPLLAAGLRFGQPGDGGYRDRLAAPGSRELCDPEPGEFRQRRVLV